MENALKGIIFEVAVTAAYAAAVQALPFLGWPIISSLFRALLTWVAGMLYEPIEKNIALGVITFKTEQQQKEYEASVEAFKKAQEQGEADAIAKAREELKKKLSDLIHFTPK